MLSQTAGCSFFSHTPATSFSPEDFAGDDRLMIQAAEDFARKEILPVVQRLEKQEPGLMVDLIRRAGQLGFCGIDTSERYGGLGLGKNLAARILEYLSLDASFSVTIGVTSGISQVGMGLFGTEEQKQRYLPRLTSGEWIGAYCLSEPNSGTDALSVTTRADRRGDSWVLNGTKMWISNAQWADFFLVIAKIDGEKLSAFLVERSFPGVKIEREEHKMGLKGSSTARVTLEDAVVPLDNLLYEEGLGHHVAFNALNLGRFKLSSMSLGPARHSIELSLAYAQERRQFGQPIATFGLVRQKAVEMAARFFAAESMIYRTGALIDGAFSAYAGDIPGNRRAAEEFAVECSACKVFTTEAEGFIVDEALQIFGGYGFTEEFAIARHYRDARVSRIYEGTNEINRVFVADRLLRRAKAGDASLVAAGDSFISELAGQAVLEPPRDQIGIGALSDLIILAYAEQSSRLRARRLGGVAAELHAAFSNWAATQAVRAYGVCTGSGASLPSPTPVDWESASEAIYGRGGPI